ncbi:DUF1289 domain-containing protein [Hyphomicrobium sp. MC8b]|uniref:DUF1289 domain-containing protein n=1 Tax=Hyphomicrobium sp. MC8b TaxID=300273 RepID=UPI00391A2C02
MARHSPCIGICKLDDGTGFCLGCARTAAEIGDWMAMSEAQRDSVWDQLPERLAQLSVRVRVLPWVRDELINWVRDTLVARQGAWVVGVPGAVAEFPSADNTPIDLHVEDGVITARRADAAFRIAINDKVRAFAFTDGGPIVLGLPRGRAAIQSGSALQAVGLDAGAIDETYRGDELFDLGIGRRYTRFCVRTRDETLTSALSDHDRRHWSDFMPVMLNQFVAVSPHRVVESAAARIEIFSRIPGSGESSPNGAHTHFLAEFLKSGDEIAPSLAPPDYVGPVAIFYPNKT